jgi:hypothetical protein
MMVRWPSPGCRIIVIFSVNKPMAGLFIPTMTAESSRRAQRWTETTKRFLLLAHQRAGESQVRTDLQGIIGKDGITL